MTPAPSRVSISTTDSFGGAPSVVPRPSLRQSPEARRLREPEDRTDMAGAVERIVRVPWEAVLAVLAGGLAIGAAFGGWGLLTDPEGLGLEEAWLDGSPFPDYTVPGLFLLLVGAGMLAAAVAALRGSRLAAPAAVLTGLLLGAFLVVGIAIVGYHGWEQVELALGIGVPALLLVVVGLSALAGERRSR